MTMHKPRIPGTFSHAITSICESIGFDKASEAVGKSESLLRRWADPDDDPLPRIDQAAALDMAYAEDHEGEPPITQTLRRMVRPAVTPKGECVRSAAFDFTSATSRLHLAIDAATAPTGPGGRKITAKEAENTLTLIDMAARQLEEMRERIKRNAPCLKVVA